jgi:hypothetical protein
MRRRATPAIAVFLVLAGLGVLLRHDLALQAWRQGNDRLAAGDNGAALAFLQKAERGRPSSLPISFDTGVALYRLGDFPQARARFAAAAADPGLRASARYNLGNCAFRQGEKAAATDRDGAKRLFQEAAGEYQQALVGAPGAADARHNLAVVRARLADLAVAAGKGGGSEAARSGNEPAGKGAAQSGKEGKQARREGDEANGRQSEKSPETAGRPSGDKSEAPVQARKAAPPLSRAEAERLLNEARGREAISAPLATKGERARLARPEKDW